MDKLDQTGRRINDFAKRSFRDVADYDYIAARMACRAQLVPQFMWSAQQAIEKYLKYILLVNRIPAKHVNHNIHKALDLTKQLPFEMVIRPAGKELIDNLAAYGQYRYLDVSYFVEGHILPKLDMAIWDIRRYCQILDVFGKLLPAEEQLLLEKNIKELNGSMEKPPQAFRLTNGLLEKIIDNPSNPARTPLIWQNMFFGKKVRTSVKSRNFFQGANSPLTLYPDMLDELQKYIKIPDRLADAYRAQITSDTEIL